MNIIFFDGDTRRQLLPLTFMRPVCELRIGILTIREKWEHLLKLPSSYITEPYLQGKFPLNVASDNLLINGSILPTAGLCDEVKRLKINEVLKGGETILALRLDEAGVHEFLAAAHHSSPFTLHSSLHTLHSSLFTLHSQLTRPWDIFRLNDAAIRADFEMVTHGRESQPISNTNKVMAPEQVFLEEGAVVECAILNANTGPIYVGKDAEILEGSLVRGGLAMCEHAALKMGAKIYGATTLGPHCKVGGEVSNAVFQAYSNKGHEGFVGNSVIGEWCNLGADTNTSNLKNNYSPVKVWSYAEDKQVDTGLQFCGLIMGDHSKSGINTMFNTGTVVGVSANIFGGDFPPKLIPSFGWGGANGFEKFRLEAAYEVAERMMGRRGVPLTEEDKGILKFLWAAD